MTVWLDCKKAIGEMVTQSKTGLQIFGQFVRRGGEKKRRGTRAAQLSFDLLAFDSYSTVLYVQYRGTVQYDTKAQDSSTRTRVLLWMKDLKILNITVYVQ